MALAVQSAVLLGSMSLALTFFVAADFGLEELVRGGLLGMGGESG